jgi:hypothetical protein
MERKAASELTAEEILKGVIEEVEEIRSESERKLRKALSVLGHHHSADIANYFFGANPKLRELTNELLKELGITK